MYLFISTETAGPDPKYSLLSASFILVDKEFNVIPISGLESGLSLQIKPKDYLVNGNWMREKGFNLTINDTQALPVQKAKKLACDFIEESLDVVNGHSPSRNKKLIVAGHGVKSFDEPFVRTHLIDDERFWHQCFRGVPFDTAGISLFLQAAGLIGLEKGGSNLLYLQQSFVPNCEDRRFVQIELAKKFVRMVRTP